MEKVEPSQPRSPQFASRLQQACDNHERCPPLHKGRLTWLRDGLVKKGLPVTIESVRKWLAGDGRPRQHRSEELAHLLGVDATWLYMGTGEPDLATGGDTAESVSNRELPQDVDLTLPIAIRSNLTVKVLGLPFDLTAAEANKIANVIVAHAASDAMER